MPSIHFLDVTNRDGVQTARTGLSKFGKVMVNFYLGRLGVAQSEIGFPFLFHEVPYVRACLALAEAGAFGDLRLSGWCRAVPTDVEAAVSVQAGGVGLQHYNLSISTSDQMIAHKFRGKLDRAAIIEEMTAAVAVARDAMRRAGGAQGADRAGGAQEKYSIGVNAEDGSRTDDGYLLEFALAARDAGAARIRYCDTIGGDSPGRIRERFAKLASAVGIPVETHCHNDLGMAVANSVSGALGDLDAGQDAWINTCVNGIGERAGNADLLSCILAFRYGFGVSETATIGDPVDLSWARRFGLWAAYAFGQPLPPAWPGVGRNAFAHESGIHADGALKDRGNYELYDGSALGPFPSDWYAREGRVVLTGEYGGKAGFRHVLDGLGIRVAEGEEDLVFSLIQLCASATGKPLTDDELRLIAGYPRQLALLFPGLLPGH
jgi:isopropylmalate/homocitrate/citramalate synthase